MLIYFYRILTVFLALVKLPHHIYTLHNHIVKGYSVLHWCGIYLGLDGKQKKTLWIQAANIGDVKSLDKLVRLLLTHSDVFIVMTVHDMHAYELLKRKFHQTSQIYVGFFPIDFYPFMYSAWQQIQPSIAIVLDYELPPEHMMMAKIADTPLWLVNQRYTDETYDLFRRFPWALSNLFSLVDIVWSSSKRDYQELQKLGISANKTRYRGNLKCDCFDHDLLSHQRQQDLIEQIGFMSNEPCITLLAASIWPGEERLAISALQRCLSLHIPVKLIIVPRYREHLKAIKRRVDQYNLPYSVRSSGDYIADHVIYIADTYGELSHFYQISDVTFIGKSSTLYTGGHNPIEAAAFGCAMVFGPNMHNYSDIVAELIMHNGGVQAATDQEIIEQLIYLLCHAESRQQQILNARSWLDTNKDCAKVIFQAVIAELYSTKKTHTEPFPPLDIYPGM